MPVYLVDAPPAVAAVHLYDYDESGNRIYAGWAVPGTATSAAAWAIQQSTYDDANNLLSVKWARGSSAYTNVWNNRASLAYS